MGSSQDVEKLLYKVSEVAEIFSVSRWTVYSYIEKGILAAIKLPIGGTRITKVSVNKFLEQLGVNKCENLLQLINRDRETKRIGGMDDLSVQTEVHSRIRRYPTNEEIMALRDGKVVISELPEEDPKE